MKTIVLMIDALDSAPKDAIEAAESQGYPFYRFVDEEAEIGRKNNLNRIKAIVHSRNRSRQWIADVQSDYICLVDSDVVLPHLAVQKMLQAPLKIVGGWVPVRGEKDRWIAGTNHPDNTFTNFPAPTKRFTATTMLPLAACVMPRFIFNHIKVRAPKIGIDPLLTCGTTGNKLIPSEPYLYSIDLYKHYKILCWMHPDVICKHLE